MFTEVKLVVIVAVAACHLHSVSGRPQEKFSIEGLKEILEYCSGEIELKQEMSIYCQGHLDHCNNYVEKCYDT